MRVISGSAGGIPLTAPKGQRIRPTSERVRESVFNILSNRLSFGSLDVLDLFAGTGGLGIEALSRGARSAVFVDASPVAQKTIRLNLKATKLRGRATVVGAYALKALTILEEKKLLFGVVFLDPPYEEGWVAKSMSRLSRGNLLLPNATVIVEHAPKERLAVTYAPLVLTESRHYGTTDVSFYETVCEE